MIIDRNIYKYIIYQEETIHNSLKKINEQKGRILIVVSERDIVMGVATNGDILRWLVENDMPDLGQPISSIANSKFKFVRDTDHPSRFQELLKEVNFLPLLNESKQLLGVVRKDHPAEGIEIGSHHIGKGHPSFVIAEIGNNHNGDISLAKQLVDAAASAGASCAKFQMRNLNSLYANAGKADDIKENLGSQYTLDLLSKFQLSNEQLFEVFDYCKLKGILPLCTPWDTESLNALEEYGMPAYKVASADLTNHGLLRQLALTGVPIICSTGMSIESEIIETENLLQSLGVPHVMLHCNSTYPAPFGDINLNYLHQLKEIVNCPVGYSGHERGIHVSIAAVALGAQVIERHITLDRTMEGSDHKASLLPKEFAEMVKGIREVEESLGAREVRKISQGEMINRVNLAKSLIINQPLKKGELIEEHMVEVKSPGRGLQPNYLNALVGKRAKHDFNQYDFFYPSDIEEEEVVKRSYKFNRPWGIPVRYHDFKEIIEGTNADLVEFHLSYKDLEVDIRQFVDEQLDLDFVIHSPELFEGDHTLDLCSLDETYRQRSIEELQRVIEVTKQLRPYFKRSVKPLIVTNVGGFTSQGFLTEQERIKRMRILEASLKELDTEGVELIPQTMPPFPWHFGGQQYHNLFVSAGEIADFCQRNDMRICLDTSHSKLACTHYKWSFHQFLEEVVPYTAHMHFADSENTGGEGLQIGEGEVDYHAVGEVINRLNPNASFIPEIWQGHENRGEGFWIALERLEHLIN